MTRAKRGNGEGTILRRARDGDYEAKITVTDPVTGQRKRVSLYGPTRAAVRAKMKAARTRADAGAPVRDAKATVGEWLARWRATTLAASDRKQATKSLYGALSRKHIEQGPIGQLPLDRLRPSDIEGLLLDLKGSGLSESTIRNIYAVLRQALDGAVRDQLIAANPVAKVKRPTVTRREAVHLSPADVGRLLTACESSRYHTALVLMAATGLRRGEVLALTWDQVDLDAGVLRVTSTMGRIDGALVVSAPKTATSRRVIPLDPSVVARLKRHRIAQKHERLAAQQWTDHGLVFTDETGGLVDPRSVLRVLQNAAKRLDLAGVGLHTLRHSAAVAWLERGVHIKAVADLLGHSSVSITGDIYGHTSDDTARSAVSGLAQSLGL